MPIRRTTITASPRPVLISDTDRPAEPMDQMDRVLEVDDDQASKSSSASAETGTD